MKDYSSHQLRVMRYKGKRLGLYFQTVPLDDFDADKRELAKKISNGEAEITPEFDELFTKVSLPPKKVELDGVIKEEVPIIDYGAVKKDFEKIVQKQGLGGPPVASSA